MTATHARRGSTVHRPRRRLGDGMGMAVNHLTGDRIDRAWGVNDALGIMRQVGAMLSR